MLTYQQKRSLYESIMQQIAPVVKSSIEQFCSQDDCQMFVKEQEQLDTEFEKIYKHFNETISHLTQEEIDHMCVDYAERYQMCCSTFPKTTIQEMFGAYTDEKKRHLDEVFDNEMEFKLEFSKIKKTLVNTFGMYEPYVELYNPFGHGTLAFIKQPVDSKLSDRTIISTIVPVINRNLPFLIDFMNANGYYLIRCSLGEDVVHYPEGGTTLMANMCFARKHPVDVSKIVSTATYLYHITPENKVNQIMSNGLVPKARVSSYSILNTDIHYPARTYFFCGDSDEEAIAYAKKDMRPGKYHLLRVDIKDLSKGLPVYPDPLLSGAAVYLEFVIPARYITDVRCFVVS